MRVCSFLAVGLWALAAAGAERRFDFAELAESQAAGASHATAAAKDQTPSGFRSTVSGKGKPGDWRILTDEVDPVEPVRTVPPVLTQRAVLGQMSQDTTDEHYPLLVYEGETFGDFKLTTKFKIVSGTAEEMAGIAFRIQDEKNYYYVRASALGNSFYFFKFVNGDLIGPIGMKAEITKGVWHELGVECRGSEINCSLDGKVLIPGMRQDTFPRGKIGFWTKSDSVSYFTDTKIEYTPLQDPTQAAVREVLKRYPRLGGLRLYVADQDPKTTRIVASKDETEIGRPGEEAERDAIQNGHIYYGKTKHSVVVTMPVRDRNGDVIAAARVIMNTFPGQTEQNAIVRATPVVKALQERITRSEDLSQ